MVCVDFAITKQSHLSKVEMNGSATIQSLVRSYFPDDTTMGGEACWVFATQNGWCR